MEEKWVSRKAFYDYCRNRATNLSLLLPPLPPPLLRLLLLSDGTVTHFLEGLFLKTISFELERQSEVIISDKDAKRLSIPKGEKGIERRGWLTFSPPLPDRFGNRSRISRRVCKSNKGRLLYAISIFPLAKLSPRLSHEILLGQKPLGQIILDQDLLFRRHALEMGRFKLPEIAQAFGFSDQEPVWARRYQLTLSGSVSGLLFEAISPTLAFSLESILTPPSAFRQQAPFASSVPFRPIETLRHKEKDAVLGKTK